MIFRTTSTRKSRARPSFTTAWPAPATSTPATRRRVRLSLSAVREEYPQFTGILTIDPDGSLFCDSLQSNRSLDLRDREYFKQAKLANGVVTLQPAFGRLTGISVLQIAYPVRSESAELKFVLLASLNLQKFAEYQSMSEVVGGEKSCSSTNRAWSWSPRQSIEPRPGRLDRELRIVPVCGRTGRRALPRDDRRRRPDLCLGRRPLAFDPGCRTSRHGRTAQGQPGRGRQPPSLRGYGDSGGGLAAAARGRMDSGDSRHRPPGRTPRRDGDQTWTWRLERADCAAVSARRARRTDDAAQRHRRIRSSASAPLSTISIKSSANPRKWRPWGNSPAAWRTTSTIS